MTTTPHRRQEDGSLVSYTRSLFRGELVSRLNRALCLAYAAGALWWGAGLLFRNGSPAYDNAVFDTLFEAAHPTAWGLAWWFAGLLLMVTAITGRGILFLWSMVAITGVLTGWVVGVLWSTITQDDAFLTTGAVALYTFSYAGITSMVLSPKPLEYEVEIYQRTEDGVIVPLKRVDRRVS